MFDLVWVSLEIPSGQLRAAPYRAAQKARMENPGFKLTRISSGCTIGPEISEYRVCYSREAKGDA